MKGKNLWGALKGALVGGGLLVAMPVQAYEGPYMAAGAGQARVEDSCNSIRSLSFISSCDDSDGGWKVTVGYQYTEYLGVELSYVDLGQTEAKGELLGMPLVVQAGSDVTSLVGTLSLPVIPEVRLMAKAGGFYSDVEVSAVAGSGFAEVDGNNFNWTWGLAVQNEINRTFGIRVELERFRHVGEKDRTGEDDIQLYSMSLIYRF